jgi:hypothetical protein
MSCSAPSCSIRLIRRRRIEVTLYSETGMSPFLFSIYKRRNEDWIFLFRLVRPQECGRDLRVAADIPRGKVPLKRPLVFMWNNLISWPSFNRLSDHRSSIRLSAVSSILFRIYALRMEFNYFCYKTSLFVVFRCFSFRPQEDIIGMFEMYFLLRNKR